MENNTVVVLDLDGVIVKSNAIKHQAMLSLFESESAHQKEIGRYLLTNNGVPRRTKIVAVLENILKIEATEDLVSGYLNRYDAALIDRLFAAPLVDGIAKFMADHCYVYYVCSSAPKHEVQGQLARAGLAASFTGIFDLDTPKADALRQIKQSHAGDAIVFLGDSRGDLRAAEVAGVPFIAVVAERDNFCGENVVKLKDFSSPELVRKSFLEALARTAESARAVARVVGTFGAANPHHAQALLTGKRHPGRG